MSNRWHIMTSIGALAITGTIAASFGQPAPTTPAQPPPAQPPSTPPASTPVQAPAQPTLDELLGLPKSTPATTPSPKPATDAPPAQPADPTKTALDRMLKEPQVSDDFVQAVSLMHETSDRLTDASDVGVQTQRLQEEILLHLDKLIDQAKKNSNKKQNQSQSQQQQQDQQQNQQQKQSSQQQNQQQQQSQPSSQAQGGNVAKQAAQPKAPPAGASASWGDLPPHVRDALLQGSSDTFSPTYEQMTQDYYKRLAEQKPSIPARPIPAPAPTLKPGPAPSPASPPATPASGGGK